jgi:hypothetical protein
VRVKPDAEKRIRLVDARLELVKEKLLALATDLSLKARVVGLMGKLEMIIKGLQLVDMGVPLRRRSDQGLIEFLRLRSFDIDILYMDILSDSRDTKAVSKRVE